MAMVFGYCDAWTRTMAIPAVSKRWLGVCQHQMRPIAVDLAWAIRNRRCAIRITDAGLAGLVLRFPGTATLILSWCANVLRTRGP